MKEIRKTHCRNAIGTTVFQIVALWFHVGIGPLIGMGPLDPGRSGRRRAARRRNRRPRQAAVGSQCLKHQ